MDISFFSETGLYLTIRAWNQAFVFRFPDEFSPGVSPDCRVDFPRGKFFDGRTIRDLGL